MVYGSIYSYNYSNLVYTKTIYSYNYVITIDTITYYNYIRLW